MKTIAIGPELRLPREAITQTFAVLAVRGAGKSNLAAVMAEGFFDAGLPFVVIDPVGAWWGLRSSAEGKEGGLPIPIFGGRHGDLPLQRGGGAELADVIAEQRISCVVDVSEFSEGDKVHFLADFAERLYRKNTQPLHLFLEEADDYAPQTVSKREGRNDARLLGAWQNIVRRGRQRGLGITMITQRSAVLNKNVLTQIETLFVLRTTAPQDTKAIGAWLAYHGGAREVLESLAGLKAGEAWVWSPQWLGILKRIQVPRRRTFDSGATPKDVAGARPPATLASVDLAGIQKRMATAIERAKADDPRELKRRVAELERQLAQQPKAETRTERIEVPVLTPAHLERLRSALAQAEAIELRLRAACDGIQAELRRLPGGDPPRARLVPTQTPAATWTSPPAARARPAKSTGDPLKRGARQMLGALARRHPTPLTRHQVATLAGLSPTSGTFSSYLSALRLGGYIHENGAGLELTPEGMAAVGPSPPDVAASTEELVALWSPRLKAGARAMLRILVDSRHPLGREELGERAGLSSTSGTFTSYLSTLRRNGLLEESGGRVAASPTLFP